MCELFLFYVIRGVLFARVIVSRNGNLYPFTNLHYFYSRQSGNHRFPRDLASLASTIKQFTDLSNN